MILRFSGLVKAKSECARIDAPQTWAATESRPPARTLLGNNANHSLTMVYPHPYSQKVIGREVGGKSITL